MIAKERNDGVNQSAWRLIWTGAPAGLRPSTSNDVGHSPHARIAAGTPASLQSARNATRPCRIQRRLTHRAAQIIILPN